VNNALVLAIAAPTAVALFTTIGWIVSVIRNARVQRAQARAAAQNDIRELLNAALEYHSTLTNWHGKFGAPSAWMHPFALSLAQMAAGYRNGKPFDGCADALKSAMEWRSRSTATQDAILFGPLKRVQECTSRLLTSGAAQEVVEACMALMEAIDATAKAWAGRWSTAASRAAADAQFGAAIEKLSGAALSATQSQRRWWGRGRRQPSPLASVRKADTAAEPVPGAVAVSAPDTRAAAAHLDRGQAGTQQQEREHGD
jgi:hypothetical protein